MAAAIQALYPEAKFGVGPIIENGFYYDMDLPQQLTPGDLPKIEKKMRELTKKDLPYERQEMPLDTAMELFKKLNQPYKDELLKDLKKHGTTKVNKEEQETLGKKKNTVSIYQTGNFTDLCRGPHVASTQNINTQTFKLERMAGAYWRGDEKRPMLQRIYGVAFHTKKELDEYLHLREEQEKRDHRKLGSVLDLFHFEDIAPGAAFWHPKGMIIMKELERFWREIHDKEGYLETSTPVMVKKSLFEQSGHWEFFKENMFSLEVEKETYALKPMNCPESTLIYSHTTRSYRDLPLRLSEIGRLHRNEKSGVLMGLTRVRQITMDDAHIYSRQDQVQEEIKGVLKLVKMFYALFGFKPSFSLSTRPEKAMGEKRLWDKAEKALAHALKESKLEFDKHPGEGAFYGPKIDIDISDSLGRTWQMATIQLDFQMPERFRLEYVDQKGKKQRPVMIHRAIFGSFERFIGILLEHTGGALPLWLAPIQVKLIGIGSAHQKYVEEIKKTFDEEGIRTELALENETVSKKIRGGELKKIPYLAVAGDKEMKAKTLRVRSTRAPKGKGDLGEIKIQKLLAKLAEEINQKK